MTKFAEVDGSSSKKPTNLKILTYNQHSQVNRDEKKHPTS